jgi:hypothetical protein
MPDQDIVIAVSVSLTIQIFIREANIDIAPEQAKASSHYTGRH